MHEQLHRAPEPCAVCDEWITEPDAVDGTKPTVERSFAHAIACWKQHLAPYRNAWDRKQPRAAQRPEVIMSDASAAARQQQVCFVFVCGVARSFAMLFAADSHAPPPPPPPPPRLYRTAICHER